MEQITIYLHSHEASTTRVQVNPDSTVAFLDDLLPYACQNTYWFRNKKLHRSFSFKWYGIKDGAHISINMENETERKEKHIFRNLFTRNKDKTKSRAQTPDPSVFSNISRENKLIKRKIKNEIEDTSSHFRKTVKRLTRTDEKEDYSRFSPLSRCHSDVSPQMMEIDLQNPYEEENM